MYLQVVLILLCIVLSETSCQDLSEPAKQSVKQNAPSDTLLISKETSEAVQLRILAELYAESGHIKEALALYKHVCFLEPNEPGNHLLTAKLFHRLGDTVNQRLYLEKEIAVNLRFIREHSSTRDLNALEALLRESYRSLGESEE